MNHKLIRFVICIMLVLLLTTSAAAKPQQEETLAPLSTAFTYQGRLTDGGTMANGVYDFRFTLYDALSGGSQVGDIILVNDLPVSDGYFIALLDFGAGAFNGQARWLEIGVRPGASSDSYTVLSPRQALTAAPYALYSQAAPWSGLSGVPAGFADGVDNDTTSFWSLTGNSGTSPGTHYIGTNDNTSLQFRVNGQSALWLSPHPNGNNVIGGYPENWIISGVYGATLFGGGYYGNTRPNGVTDGGGTVSGGLNNLAGNNTGDVYDALFATVSGGLNNQATGRGSTVGGGVGNVAVYDSSTVSGGYYNSTGSGGNATIGGGYMNYVDGPSSTISGGAVNIAYGWHATIGGGESNTVNGSHDTIGGGYENDTSEWYPTVSGGAYNMAGNRCTVGGGYGNTANADYATVGGGNANQALANNVTIGGGTGNSAVADAVSISGGDGNYTGIEASRGTIGGGWHNYVNGNAATVPGGAENEATAAYSFAAGAQAHATHAGSFVWSSGEATYSYADRSFTVRAHGGVRFYTAPGTGTGVVLAAGGGSFSSLSDRNAKENFTPVDGQKILAQVAQLPITSWNYKSQEDEIRHMGPVAQDFSRLFGLGEDDTHITTVDADGVALAAIQGLYELSQEQAAQIESLAAENSELKAQLSEFETRLERLESGTTGSGSQISTLSYLPLIGLAALVYSGAYTWRRKAGSL